MNGNEHLWRQFEKLGEMMGDGLHHEADGKWISVEYKKLASSGRSHRTNQIFRRKL